MPKVSAEKRAELESFWRHHHEGWKQSPLNQREYCELHGLPLKRFGNWRDQFKVEDAVHQAGLHRRGGLSHMSGHMSDRENAPVSAGYIPSARSAPDSRHNFRPSEKKRMVAEAMRPGSSVSGVARRYGLAPRVRFRWKQELAPKDSQPLFLPVTVDDDMVAGPAIQVPLPQGAGPIVIERSRHAIEIELTGGRRVRFARDIDPTAMVVTAVPG